MRGLNAPPRSMVAPPCLATRADSISCSRLSTEQGPGDEGDVPSAKAGPAHGDDGVGVPELPAHQLVGPEDGKHLVDPRVRLQGQAGDDVSLPHDAYHRDHVAGGHVPAGAGALQQFQDAVDVFRAWPSPA